MKVWMTAAALTGGLAMAVPAVAAPGPWTLDTSHSSLNFSVRHLMVSKVRGRFNVFSGKLDVDTSGKLKSAQGTVDVKSIDTQNAKRDAHLRAEDFFEAAKYPTMKFVTTKVTHKGNNTAVQGKLTIKNITKTVTLAGNFLGKSKVNFGQGMTEHIGYTLSGKINRKDFGLNFNGVMNGVAAVGDDVELEIEMEAMRKL